MGLVPLVSASMPTIEIRRGGPAGIADLGYRDDLTFQSNPQFLGNLSGNGRRLRPPAAFETRMCLRLLACPGPTRGSDIHDETD